MKDSDVLWVRNQLAVARIALHDLQDDLTEIKTGAKRLNEVPRCGPGMVELIVKRLWEIDALLRKETLG